MKLRFVPEAREEVREAIDYYELQRVGLGRDFAQELGRAVRRVLDYPVSFEIIYRECRRCRLKRFPFGVVYQVDRSDTLVVYSVMYLGRRPGYWHDRL